jgi:hypothetical protein
MKKIINILAFCPGPNDATSFYRGLGPLYELQNSGIINNIEPLASYFKQHEFNVLTHNINIIQGNAHSFSWSQIAQADIVFIQRPHQPVLREVARLAKRLGKPLWVDLDDDHLDVPTHHRMYHVLTDFDNIEAHKDILNVADVVTFSTDHLLKTYFKRGLVHNVELVPNALPEWLDNITKLPTKKSDFRILWRGSETHSKDLAMYLPQLNQLIKNYPDIMFTFFGYVPAVNNAPNVEYIPHTNTGDLVGYFTKLYQLQANLVIVPLEFNNFNRCKSNIAMLEAHWSGAHCIGPAMPEWENCYLNYLFDSFTDSVTAYLNDSNREAPQPIQWLEKSNEVRQTIITKLYNREYKVNNML